MGQQVEGDLVESLEEAAQPVELEAEALAVSRIRNMPRSPRWAGMRIGVSRMESLVYMVPAARSRRRTKRPNLADLLLTRAMDPALEHNAAQVEKTVDHMLAELAGKNGF